MAELGTQINNKWSGPEHNIDKTSCMPLNTHCPFIAGIVVAGARDYKLHGLLYHRGKTGYYDKSCLRVAI